MIMLQRLVRCRVALAVNSCDSRPDDKKGEITWKYDSSACCHDVYNDGTYGYWSFG